MAAASLIDAAPGRGWWRPTVITAIITTVVGIVSFAVFLWASTTALPGDPAIFKERIAHGFAAGDLVENPFQEGSTTIGSHQWNDCLIIVMAMDERGDPARLALSPILMDFGATPSVSTNPCAVLSALNQGATPNGNLYYYDNYPHGAVVLLRHLLPYREIERIRADYRNLLSALLIASLALVMVGLARGQNMRGFAAIGVTSVALMRYFGLESFSQSLGHGPADAVLAAYTLALAAMAFRPTGLALAVVAAAVCGALTMIFELFTGGVPLGLAMVIGLTPLVVRPAVRPGVAATASAATFLGAGAIFYLLKMAAVMMIAGGGIAGDALAEAFRLTIFVPDGVRKDGTGFATAIRETFHSVDTLTGGMGLIAGATIAIALAAGAYGFVQVWRSERSAAVRGQALMLALSLFIPPLWCVFFLNLMINHSWFTDRIFVWLIAGGFSLFFLDLLSRGKGRETA
ncbi:MAG: hypothetical protein ABIO69_02945 [Sphingomicrobium sp.]